MEPMILGESLANGSQDYLGYWMPSGGDTATYTVKVFLLSTANKFKLRIETKETEEADSSAVTLGAALLIAAKGITKTEQSGAKELVRYVIEPVGGSTDYIHFEGSAPQWVPN